MKTITSSLLLIFITYTAYAKVNGSIVDSLYEKYSVPKNTAADLKKLKYFIQQDSLTAEDKIKTSIITATTYLREGDKNGALKEIDESLQLAKRHKLYILEAELLKLISREYRLSGMAYLGKNYLHSAINVASKAMENDELHYFYGDAYHELAYYSIEKKDFQDAIHQLKKGNKSLDKIGDSSMKKHYLASNYQLISDSYLKLKNTDSALYYLHSALHLLKGKNPEGKGFLRNLTHSDPVAYFVHNEDINEEKYPGDVLKTPDDKVKKKQNGSIDHLSTVIDISKTDKSIHNRIFTFIEILCLLSLIAFVLIKRKSMYKKDRNEETSEKKVLNMAHETEQKILQKIKFFEQDGQFRDQNISLTYLANQFNTNTKYLSTVLKKIYGKDYSTYINELRIAYISDILEQEKKYRQYKISHLAEISGFSSHSKFASVFKKVKGCSPSEFINNIDGDFSRDLSPAT